MVNFGLLVPDHNMDNVLGVENPDTYGGRLWQYLAGHSTLFLRLWQYLAGHSTLFLRFYQDHDSEVQRFHVKFEGVRYIEWTTFWRGGNLKTATEEECLSLLNEPKMMHKSVGVDSEWSGNYIRRSMRLFIVETPLKRCQIWASAGIIISKDPSY